MVSTSDSSQQFSKEDYPVAINTRDYLRQLEIVQDIVGREPPPDYSTSIDNLENLQQLETEKSQLSKVTLTTLTAFFVMGLTTFSVAWLFMLFAWRPAVRLEKVSRLIRLITEILEAFEEMRVEMLPLLKVPKCEPIDLFVRFPGKEFLLFSVRSYGDSAVVYHETKQALYHKRVKRQGLSRCKPDPLIELTEQEFWLRKNRKDLFGGSAKGSRRPMAKVVVIWKPSRLFEHREHLYSTLSDQRFVFIRKEGGAYYLIYRDQVIDFIRAYLAHRQSQEREKAA
ncbi:unknown protein (plasmid) [Leptolyngbya sp. NIES-3755]|nr:unknown protein [Leptolyngbya sp. NIES-3755]